MRTLQGVVDRGLVYREGCNLSMSTLAQRREEAEFIANIIRPFVTGVWVGRQVTSTNTQMLPS